MKRSIVLLAGLLSVMVTGCGSTPIKMDFGTEYGWLCTSKENAKRFVKYEVPGEQDGTCIKLPNEKDPTRDFYVRDYEKDTLPPMPDLP
jgi:hypothetical protein